MSEPSPSRREAQLIEQKIRRARLRTRRESLLEAVIAGESYTNLARQYGFSDRTVRREVGRALNERDLDAPTQHTRLQVARLGRTLKMLDRAIVKGDYHAVSPLLKVLDKLDRYHQLGRPQAPVEDVRHLLWERLSRGPREESGAKDQSSP